MKKNNIKLNIIYQMLYEILALALPLVTSPYISRVLGAEKIGIYSYTYSIAYYFGIFALLGVKNYGNREIAKNRDDQKKLNETFSNIYCLQVIVSLIVILIYSINMITFKADYKIYLIVQMLYVISCLLDINWFFFGMEQFKLTVIRNTFIKLATFIAIFTFIHNESDLIKYCLIMSGGALLSQMAIWMYLPKYVKIVKPEYKKVISHLKPMIILFVPVIAVSFYNIMDKIMLGAISSKEQLGFYENSEKIIFCVKTVITSFGTVMMPRMSKLVADGNEKQSNRYMSLSMEFVMMISFALAFGIASVAQIFAPIFWGIEFEPCGLLLIGLSISIPISAFSNVIRTQFLIPKSMDKVYIYSVICGAITNVVINTILISKMEAMGAVIGTIWAEIVVCAVQIIFIRKEINIKQYIKKGLPFFIFGTIMALSVKCIDYIGNSTSIQLLIIEIFVGAIVYLILASIYLKYANNEVFVGIIKKRELRN